MPSAPLVDRGDAALGSRGEPRPKGGGPHGAEAATRWLVIEGDYQLLIDRPDGQRSQWRTLQDIKAWRFMVNADVHNLPRRLDVSTTKGSYQVIVYVPAD